MNYQEYAPLAVAYVKKADKDTTVIMALLGLSASVGELSRCVLPTVAAKQELNKPQLRAAIGNCFWHLNLLWHIQEIRVPDRTPVASRMHTVKAVGIDIMAVGLLAICGNVATNFMTKKTSGDCTAIYAVQTMLETLAMRCDIDVERCLDENIQKLSTAYTKD